METISIFSVLPDDDLTALENLVVHRRYHKGDDIVREGDPASALHIIHGGEVKVYRLRPDGGEQVLRVLGEGDFFGELALLSGARSPSTATVVSPSLVCAVHQRDLRTFLLEHPRAMYAILTALVGRLAQAEDIVENIASFDSRQKAAALLLTLAQRQGRQTKQGTEIKLSLNRADLASMVGLTQETLSRRMSEFREQGWIQTKGYRCLYLTDEAALARLLEEDPALRGKGGLSG